MKWLRGGPVSPAPQANSTTSLGAEVSRDDFKLLQMLGKGQWGKVFLVQKKFVPGQEAASDGVMALKEIQLNPNSNVAHVQNERLIMEYVSPSPFIVVMHHAFRTDRYLYFALDFASGGDLFRHWRKYRDRRAEMAPLYSAEVLLALEHLHKHKVIYRDLKPENVLLDGQGHIKLADMGLAKLLVGDDARTNSFCGTEAYLAPEMIRRTPYGTCVDMWQYGCFIFELYAGRSPFWLPKKPRKFLRENILMGAFGFPSAVPDCARGLISGLLDVVEARRLGCGKDMWAPVKADPYFANMCWEKVATRQVPAPIVPEDPGQFMVNNFDEDFTCQPVDYGVDQEGGHVWLANELKGFAYSRPM